MSLSCLHPEMALRAVRWCRDQQNSRDQRVARWRDERTRLFGLPDSQRRQVRHLWRTCPYPADPSYFGDLLHEIAIGKLDPNQPPWVFHRTVRAKTPRIQGHSMKPSGRSAAERSAAALRPRPRMS